MKNILNPVDYSKTAVESYKLLYGKDLVSIILYGSGAGGDFDPRKSDVNLLIVLTSMDVELIAKSSEIQSRYLRERFSIPLFMNKKYIEQSLDSYPVEFLNLKGCYRVLYGEDVFESLSIESDHLRLQIERELKGKWLHLLQEFPYARKNRKNLLELARLSLKAYAPVFRAMLHIKGVEIPLKRNELLKEIESAYTISDQSLSKISESFTTINLPEMEKRFVAYAKALESLINTIEFQ
ncbi:MAG: hypothetical protein JW915_01995 [Chitinispirillaceae bacterium]|nr:hypothetical protein [Chitinispirillaceae bacterium]